MNCWLATDIMCKLSTTLPLAREKNDFALLLHHCIHLRWSTNLLTTLYRSGKEVASQCTKTVLPPVQSVGTATNRGTLTLTHFPVAQRLTVHCTPASTFLFVLLNNNISTAVHSLLEFSCLSLFMTCVQVELRPFGAPQVQHLSDIGTNVHCSNWPCLPMHVLEVLYCMGKWLYLK